MAPPKFRGYGLTGGAGGKGPRQKTSKIVKKCQKVFRHFSTTSRRAKKRQKASKSFSTLFDNFAQGKKRQKASKSVKTLFARHHFSGPFGGLWLEKGASSPKIPISLQGTARKIGGFLDSKRPFLRRSEMGVF